MPVGALRVHPEAGSGPWGGRTVDVQMFRCDQGETLGVVQCFGCRDRVAVKTFERHRDETSRVTEEVMYCSYIRYSIHAELRSLRAKIRIEFKQTDVGARSDRVTPFHRTFCCEQTPSLPQGRIDPSLPQLSTDPSHYRGTPLPALPLPAACLPRRRLRAWQTLNGDRVIDYCSLEVYSGTL